MIDNDKKELLIPGATITAWKPQVSATDSSLPAPDIYNKYDDQDKELLREQLKIQAETDRKAAEKASEQNRQYQIYILYFLVFSIIAAITADQIGSSWVAGMILFLALCIGVGGVYMKYGGMLIQANKK